MKRAIAILLLGIFSFNLVGFFFVFKIQQYEVRQEMKMYIKEGVPENQLARITVTPENRALLDWKHKREFRYRGTMYDVVRTEVIHADEIIYHCVTDEQEAELFDDLDERVRKNMDNQHKGSNLPDGLFKLYAGMHQPPYKATWTLSQTGIIISSEYTCHYASPVFDIMSPPPKTV